MANHVVVKSTKGKFTILSVVGAIMLATVAPIAAQAAAPVLNSVSPSAGTAAGGTSITISGSGFTGVSCPSGVTLGGAPVASCTVTNDTTISATLPSRTGNAKTIGAQDISITNGAETSAPGTLRYSYIPAVDSSQTKETLVQLGELASRSQRKLVTRSTSSPFQVNGTDSLTGDPYSYYTNYAYDSGSHTAAYSREGDQPGYHTGAGTATLSTKSVTPTTYGGRSVQYLKSNGNCNGGGRPNNNLFDSGDGSGLITTYCTVFGPEIYSESFYATSAQALAFEWKALGITDDYSVYGYLVEVANDTSLPTPSTTNTKLVMHGVGSKTVTQADTNNSGSSDDDGWTTSTANVPTSGLYRFRFVNGSYDGTGGQAIGADFYIGSVLMAGDRNDITLANPGDKLTGTGTWTTTASATSNQTVVIQSLTPSVCTVTYTGAPTTTATITQNGTTLGTCTLQASQGSTGVYAPAATVTTSFEIRASAVAPEAPTITSVTPGNTQLTVNFSAPNRDGGAAITKYQYQVGSGSWVDLPSTPAPFTISGLTNGTTYQIKVRAVSSAGTGTASGQSPGTPANVLTITSANTKSGTIGTALSHTLTGSGGTAPYSWSISSGTLPGGLSRSSDVISGTPTTAATTSVTVTLTDAASVTKTQTLTFTITANNPTITSSASTSGTNGSAFTHSLTGSGGTSPYTWSSGTLPTGLSLSGSTISGTPTVDGTFTVTITITDSASGTTTQTLTITLAAAVVISSPSAPSSPAGPSPSPSPSTSVNPSPIPSVKPSPRPSPRPSFTPSVPPRRPAPTASPAPSVAPKPTPAPTAATSTNTVEKILAGAPSVSETQSEKTANLPTPNNTSSNTLAKAVKPIAEVAAEKISGFAPAASLRIEVIGSRITGQFVLTPGEAGDPIAIAKAIEESTARNKTEFTSISEVARILPPLATEVYSAPVDKSQIDLFAASGLAKPISLATMNFSNKTKWINVKASATTYVPGTTIYLTVTTQPIIFAQAVVDKFGKANITGSLPIDLLENGGHSLRIVGVRSLAGVSTDKNGEIQLSDSAIGEIRKFDAGTKATVLLSGQSADGGLHTAMREIPLDRPVAWWTVWFALILGLLTLVARLVRRPVGATRRLVTAIVAFAAGLPAAVLGWVNITYEIWVGVGIALAFGLFNLLWKRGKKRTS